MIYLIYQLDRHTKPRAHIALAQSVDEIMFGGNYQAICGCTASRNRRWTFGESRAGIALCAKCDDKLHKDRDTRRRAADLDAMWRDLAD